MHINKIVDIVVVFMISVSFLLIILSFKFSNVKYLRIFGIINIIISFVVFILRFNVFAVLPAIYGIYLLIKSGDSK